MLKNRIQIKKWLDKYEVKDYVINEDLTVDVEGGLHIVAKNLTSINVQFNIVHGTCDLSNNKLTSLKGSPKIVKGTFYCNHNQLESLQFTPESVAGNFDCSYNPIINMDNFLCQFTGNFHHKGCVIEQVSNLYQIKNVYGYFAFELNLSYSEIQKVLLYNKINNIIADKPENLLNKKLKI